MGPRMTLPTRFVLQAFLAEPDDTLYGTRVSELAGLASGTTYPILARLEALGWLSSAWEDVDPRAEGRPARRYYRLTALGTTEARRALHAPRAMPRGWPRAASETT